LKINSSTGIRLYFLQESRGFAAPVELVIKKRSIYLTVGINLITFRQAQYYRTCWYNVGCCHYEQDGLESGNVL
jgi:hypothetical protein